MKEYTSESDDSILIEDIKISNILKKKNDRKKRIFYINSFSVDSVDDTSDSECLQGGYKFDIVKTFINKIKKNPKFKKNFKNYKFESIKPSGKDIVMAAIIDSNLVKAKLSQEQLTEKHISEYIFNGDYIPLIFGNTDNKNIIYLKQINTKGKKRIVRSKKTVFSEKNGPIVIFFKVNSNLKFFKPVKKEKDDDKIESIDSTTAVMEYIIGRNFMLIPNPKENLKIKSINNIVYKNDNFELKQFKDESYQFEKMTIEEFENILGMIVKQCTKFQ